jgi:hypothetical protein
MTERDMQLAAEREQQFQQYVRDAAGSGGGGGGTAEELAKLADLRERGVISPQEFEQQKARLLA